MQRGESIDVWQQWQQNKHKKKQERFRQGWQPQKQGWFRQGWQPRAMQPIHEEDEETHRAPQRGFKTRVTEVQSREYTRETTPVHEPPSEKRRDANGYRFAKKFADDEMNHRDVLTSLEGRANAKRKPKYKDNTRATCSREVLSKPPYRSSTSSLKYLPLESISELSDHTNELPDMEIEDEKIGMPRTYASGWGACSTEPPYPADEATAQKDVEANASTFAHLTAISSALANARTMDETTATAQSDKRETLALCRISSVDVDHSSPSRQGSSADRAPCPNSLITINTPPLAGDGNTCHHFSIASSASGSESESEGGPESATNMTETYDEISERASGHEDMDVLASGRVNKGLNFVKPRIVDIGIQWDSRGMKSQSWEQKAKQLPPRIGEDLKAEWAPPACSPTEIRLPMQEESESTTEAATRDPNYVPVALERDADNTYGHSKKASITMDHGNAMAALRDVMTALKDFDPDLAERLSAMVESSCLERCEPHLKSNTQSIIDADIDVNHQRPTYREHERDSASHMHSRTSFHDTTIINLPPKCALSKVCDKAAQANHHEVLTEQSDARGDILKGVPYSLRNSISAASSDFFKVRELRKSEPQWLLTTAEQLLDDYAFDIGLLLTNREPMDEICRTLKAMYDSYHGKKPDEVHERLEQILCRCAALDDVRLQLELKRWLVNGPDVSPAVVDLDPWKRPLF